MKVDMGCVRTELDVVGLHHSSFIPQASAPGACRPRFNYSGGQVLGSVDQQAGVDRWKLVKAEEEVRVCSCSTSLELIGHIFRPASWCQHAPMLSQIHLVINQKKLFYRLRKRVLL